MTGQHVRSEAQHLPTVQSKQVVSVIPALMNSGFLPSLKEGLAYEFEGHPAVP
jgi:hypothetical protein